MDLIDRYIQEVGRHLPRKNRSDIQTELKSLLVDSLEDRAEGEATEADIVAVLEEFGAPKEVAASYYPEGQYLVGPEIYPFFRMVAGIVVAAVFGAQLLALVIAFFVSPEPVIPLEVLGGIFTSLPSAFGMVVIVFMILQYLNVNPKTEDEPWDPRTLPVINAEDSFKRWEKVFGIAGGMVLLAILWLLPNTLVVIFTPEVKFFANPVLMQYLPLISVSLLLNIGLDVVLLQQGRWTLGTRAVKIAFNLFGIFVLYTLVDGHTAWLTQHGAGGFLDTVKRLSEMSPISNEVGQLMGMHAFRLAFFIALIVTAIETVGLLYRLVRASLRPSQPSGLLPPSEA